MPPWHHPCRFRIAMEVQRLRWSSTSWARHSSRLWTCTFSFKSSSSKISYLPVIVDYKVERFWISILVIFVRRRWTFHNRWPIIEYLFKFGHKATDAWVMPMCRVQPLISDRSAFPRRKEASGRTRSASPRCLWRLFVASYTTPGSGVSWTMLDGILNDKNMFYSTSIL